MMTPPPRPRRLVLLALLLTVTGRGSSVRISDLPHCNITHGNHPKWLVVKCILTDQQDLNINENDLPPETNELSVTGGNRVTLLQMAMTKLLDPRFVNITNTRLLMIHTYAAKDLNNVNMLMHISNIKKVIIQTWAFTGITGPLSIDIENVDDASIHEQSFAWLLRLNLKNIKKLYANRAAFVLDSRAPNVGAHGPGMMINIEDSALETLPEAVFKSSAAHINLKNLELGTVATDAFSANTYNSVLIFNCSIAHIEKEAFGKKSLFFDLKIQHSRIKKIDSDAFLSGVNAFEIAHTTFDNVSTGSVNGTYASVLILNSTFHRMAEKSFQFAEWNTLRIEKTKFDEVPKNAIIAIPTTTCDFFSFKENEIETFYPDSLEFVGLIFDKYVGTMCTTEYKSNYYGQQCTCDMATNLSLAFSKLLPMDKVKTESHCIVTEEIARCFNIFEQNMILEKFLIGVCVDGDTIMCEEPQLLNGTEIKNPRFPHVKEESGLSDRNKKVIGIVIVTCLGCALLAFLISLIRWMRQKGYCTPGKDWNQTSTSGENICMMCSSCARPSVDGTGSISQISIHDYTERQRLNDTTRVDVIQETTLDSTLPQMYTDEGVPTEDRTTQTLPEELTKELIDNLKEKLDDPEKYVEAREMIEHLYELIKVDQDKNSKLPSAPGNLENIYDLPLFENTTPRVGKNNKKMVSVGTKVPSLDRLQPLSPYGSTTLAHEYFEPRDMAIHMYAEIANYDKEKKKILGIMPDVVEGMPREPISGAKNDQTSPYAKHFTTSGSNVNNSTIKSSKSISSSSSAKMINRPLPQKPVAVLDPGEGPSRKCL